MCFKPDGSQLIVAAGQRVLVYDASDGKYTMYNSFILTLLKPHDYDPAFATLNTYKSF